MDGISITWVRRGTQKTLRQSSSKVPLPPQVREYLSDDTRKVDIRLPGKGTSDSRGARLVY